MAPVKIKQLRHHASCYKSDSPLLAKVVPGHKAYLFNGSGKRNNGIRHLLRLQEHYTCPVFGDDMLGGYVFQHDAGSKAFQLRITMFTINTF